MSDTPTTDAPAPVEKPKKKYKSYYKRKTPVPTEPVDPSTKPKKKYKSYYKRKTPKPEDGTPAPAPVASPAKFMRDARAADLIVVTTFMSPATAVSQVMVPTMPVPRGGVEFACVEQVTELSFGEFKRSIRLMATVLDNPMMTVVTLDPTTLALVADQPGAWDFTHFPNGTPGRITLYHTTPVRGGA